MQALSEILLSHLKEDQLCTEYICYSRPQHSVQGSYAVVYRNYLVQNVTYKKIMRLSFGRQKGLVSVNHYVAPHNSLMFLNNGRSCVVHVISNFFEERYSVIG